MEAYVWKVVSLNGRYWFGLDYVEDEEDLFVSYLFDTLSDFGYGLTYGFGRRTEPVGESKLFCFRDAASAIEMAGPFDLVVRGRAGIGPLAASAKTSLRMGRLTEGMLEQFWRDGLWLRDFDEGDFGLFNYLDPGVVLVDWFEVTDWIWPMNVKLGLFLLRHFGEFYYRVTMD